jgi:hypothetical protein
MASPSGDHSVLGKISQVREEETWYGKDKLSDDHRAGPGEWKVQPDHCWDLLRHHRAWHEFGDRPDKAKARSAKIVEKYQQ